MTTEKAKSIKDQTLKLSDLKGIDYKIAQAELKYNGVYFIIIDGKRTEIII